LGVFWTIIWLTGLGQEAWADAAVEMAVVGVHATHQAEGAGQAIAKAVDALPTIGVVQREALAEELAGAGPRVVTRALQAEGLAMLSEGRVLYEQADLEAAKLRIADAVVSLESALAGGLDSRSLMEALLVQANIAIGMGDTSTAARAFKQAVRIDPKRTLDPVHFPPKMVQLFNDVRGEVLAVPSGAISLAGVWSDHEVFVDGRLVGKGITEVEGLVPGRHHVLIMGPAGDRSYAAVAVMAGKVSEYSHSQGQRFVGGVAERDDERSALTRQLYASLSDTWTSRVVLVAGETGVDEVGLQLYEPRTGRFSVAHRAPADGDPVGAILTLVPKLEGMCEEDGTLAPGQVSDESLALDINSNPTMSDLLFSPRSALRAGAAGVPTSPSPTPSVSPERRQGGIHWAVWAGAGVVVVGATTAALLLRDQSEAGSSGTGTVLVSF
jgi:tetratricopeptide (TPR) repeat protein